MSDGIECPYCSEECLVDDWCHMREGKEYTSNCDNCGNTFTWSWENIPQFLTERID
ncbi:MAG: hypothetical protein IMY67_12215 [Bacteroidetes bacterium]|nr:hypothetical protein [Bacteroidota bacterium]